MGFLAWHYSKGIELYLKGWRSFIDGTLRFFSLPVLTHTLFSPWKRLNVKSRKSGFNLTKSFDEFTFNTTSRLIGFMVRLALIGAAGLFAVASIFLGALGFVIWLLLPFLSLQFYQKYQKQPSVIAQDLIYQILASQNPIYTLFNNHAGQFVLAHVGLEAGELVSRSTNIHTGLDNNKAYKGYANILQRVLESGVWSEDFWQEKEIQPDDLVLAARIWDARQTLESRLPGYAGTGNVKGVGVSLLFGYTPTLDKIGKELRLEPNRPIVLRGRDEVLQRIDRILTSHTNVLLVGQPGVGKQALLLELADRLDRNYQRLVEVSVVELTAGITDRNERKIVIQDLLKEASSAGNAILVLKDLPRLTNSAVEGTDYTDIFEAQLESGKLKLICVVTPEEYERYLARNYRLMKHFERVEVEPLSSEAAIQVLLDRAAILEAKSGITITIPILRKMVLVSDRYFSDVPFPKKALELLDSTVSYVQHGGKQTISYDDVAKVASEKSGVPLSALTQEDKKKLANIESLMRERLIGQETPLKLIAQSLRSRTMGVSDANRPVGTYLFLGPTGVGKTETAKVLSNIYFGHSDIMRFDMAEFVGYEGITKLIGSAHLNQPGMLTTAIRNNPAGMLLLDELEKASSDIFNILLTLIDEGYIMDAFGRKIDCRNIFVIATSNAGSEQIRTLVDSGVTGDDLQNQMLEHVLHEKHFAPEFINRFDGVVVYEPLNHEHLTEIAKLQLSALKKRLFEKNIHIELPDNLFSKVAQDGFHPHFGARPMRRVVDLIIGDLVSQALLSDEIKPGDKIRIVPGTNQNEYTWEKLADSPSLY